VVYTSGRVNLRSGCGTSHPKLAIVRAAARVEILDRSENCAQARIATGEIGWIPLSLLQLVPIEEGKHGP
jgi:SH3-like domain-containing protein